MVVSDGTSSLDDQPYVKNLRYRLIPSRDIDFKETSRRKEDMNELNFGNFFGIFGFFPKMKIFLKNLAASVF